MHFGISWEQWVAIAEAGKNNYPQGFMPALPMTPVG